MGGHSSQGPRRSTLSWHQPGTLLTVGRSSGSSQSPDAAGRASSTVSQPSLTIRDGTSYTDIISGAARWQVRGPSSLGRDDMTASRDEPMWSEELRRLRVADPESLRLFYECHLKRFLSDNDRIWTSGALFVPLSLAPFLALPQLDYPEPEHFLILGAISTVLVFFWLAIAETHRSFQERSYKWMIAIEETLNLSRSATGRPALTGAAKYHLARLARRVIVPVVVALWILAALTWPDV